MQAASEELWLIFQFPPSTRGRKYAWSKKNPEEGGREGGKDDRFAFVVRRRIINSLPSRISLKALVLFRETTKGSEISSYRV